MKVLKNNYNYASIEIPQKYPRKMFCDSCESELEYDKSDIRIGEYGWAFIDCPLCGYENLLDDESEHMTLTSDNIKFPIHFYNFSTDKNAVDVSELDIEEWIRKGINYFRENKEQFAWYTGSGNTHVSVYRMDGDENYNIIVAKNYYESEIPFEKEDY